MLLKHGLVSIIITVIATTTCSSQNTLTTDTVKLKAFNILVNRCNFCHATKKKQDVFTLLNMDSLARAINEQVFVKKNMPKGRKNRLNSLELELLQTWLARTKYKVEK